MFDRDIIIDGRTRRTLRRVCLPSRKYRLLSLWEELEETEPYRSTLLRIIIYMPDIRKKAMDSLFDLYDICEADIQIVLKHSEERLENIMRKKFHEPIMQNRSLRKIKKTKDLSGKKAVEIFRQMLKCYKKKDYHSLGNI